MWPGNHSSGTSGGNNYKVKLRIFGQFCLPISGRQLEGILPRKLYRSFTHYYYGDHIEWETLESFSISQHKDKDQLVDLASSLNGAFLHWVEEGSKKPIEPFSYRPIFRAPENVNNLWVSEVGLASAFYMLAVDQFNIFLNGGIISEEGGEHRYYQEKKELGFLRELSKQYESAQGFINDTLKEKEVMKSMALMMLDLQTVHSNGCFYDQVAENKGTIYQTFIENVSKEKFLIFTNKIVEELKKLLRSEKTEKIVTNWLKGIQKKLQTIDTEKLTSDSYLVFLRARSLVLGVDLEKVFEDLNEVYAFILKGMWQTQTGQWPAMVEFISNFYKHTFASKQFWERLDTLYQEQVRKTKKFYEDRQKSLDSNMTDDILPAFRSLLEFMVQIREGRKTFVDDYMSDLEKVDLNEILGDHLASLASVLSNNFLSCYTALHGKPDFDLMDKLTEDNTIVKATKELVFTNWPKDEILPKGFEDFVQKLADGILLLVTSVLGACSDNMVR